MLQKTHYVVLPIIDYSWSREIRRVTYQRFRCSNLRTSQRRRRSYVERKATDKGLPDDPTAMAHSIGLRDIR
jgi:hypothetical protein